MQQTSVKEQNTLISLRNKHQITMFECVCRVRASFLQTIGTWQNISLQMLMLCNN